MTEAQGAVTALGGAGERMHALASQLFPICRSITGDGARATLREIRKRIPLELHEVPSGTQVLDWIVPDEWNIRDAYVATSAGQRVVDFHASNLHVVGYSEPVRARMTLAELRPHIHTHPGHPDWIPYRTSYYTRSWGFCLSERHLESLAEETYDVAIDTTLGPGSLSYGELLIPGERDDEVLLTTHICHPSLANDNLSGIALLVELASTLAEVPHALSYRFLFIPGTIGSIAWLARNEETVSRVVAGLVVACVGDAGPFTYKRSRRGDTLTDRAAAHVVSHAAHGRVLDFVPWGWDERQFNSPGFNLPVGCLTRSREGEFPEYHSSADDLELIEPKHLEESLGTALEILNVLEHDGRYLNLSPRGEPQLGTRSLYRGVGGGPNPGTRTMALLWVLNQSDGAVGLVDIAERSGIAFAEIRRAADALVEAGLLSKTD